MHYLKSTTFQKFDCESSDFLKFEKLSLFLTLVFHLCMGFRDFCREMLFYEHFCYADFISLFGDCPKMGQSVFEL